MKRFAGVVALVAFEAAGGPPAKLAFTNAPLQIQAGVCSPMMVVQLQDDAGTAVPAAADLAVGLSGAVELHGAMDCAGPAITQARIDAGTSEMPFSVLETVAGRYPVTASAAGLSSAAQDVEVLPGPPGRIDFPSGPYEVTAGECSHTAFVVRDVNGNVSPPPPPGLTIRVTSTTTNVRIFADPACLTPWRDLVLSAPDAGGDFYFEGIFPGMASGVPESFLVFVDGPGFGTGHPHLLQPVSADLVLRFADGGPNTTGSALKLHAAVTNHGPGFLTAPRLAMGAVGLELEPGPYVLPDIPPGATVELEVSGIITAAPSSEPGLGVSVGGRPVTSGGLLIGPEVDLRLTVVPRVADLGNGCGCSEGGLPLAAGVGIALASALRGSRRRR